MKLKKAVLLPAFLMLATSCGGTSGETPVVDGDFFIKEATTIQLSTTAGKSNLQVINRYIEDFKEIEPNVTVTVQQIQSDYSGLASNIIDGFAVNNYPDMAMVYPDAVADFIDYGKAYDLEPYMYNEEYGWTDEEIKNIVPEFLEEGKKYTVNGTYSLPFSKSTEVVYYNKDAIENLVLEGDGNGNYQFNNGNPITVEVLNNLTWESFWGELCPAIMYYVENNPNGATLLDTSGDDYAVLGYDSDANFFITLAEQYGYDYTAIENGIGKALFVNDGMKALMKDLSTYASKHYVLTQKSTGKRANDFFKVNQCLFSVGSTAGAQYQIDSSNPMNVGVMKLPRAEKGEEKVILQGPSMAFLSHPGSDGRIDENRKLASWLFYKFMITGDAENGYNSSKWAFQTNYLPVLKSTYETEDYKMIYDESQYQDKKTLDVLCCRIATLCTELTNSYYTSPAFKGSSGCRDEVDNLLGKVVAYGTDNGKTIPDSDLNAYFQTAFDNAAKEIG